MNEFEFRDGSLEANDLRDGDKVECTYSENIIFTKGRKYHVSKHRLYLVVYNEDGIAWPLCAGVWFKPVLKKTKHSDFKDALEYLDTFGIPAEVTDKGIYIEGELTKVQWLDFAKILLEGEE